MTSGMMTSLTDEWATPQGLFDKLNAEYCFTLDPCSTHENAKCNMHYTKDDDGLSKNWGGANCVYEPTIWERNRQVGSESF